MRSVAVVVALVTGLGLVVVIVWGIDQHQQTDWWAAWGQWVGGVGSILAAAIAVVIAYMGWKKSDEQSKAQAERLEKIEAQDHASKFGVWIEPVYAGNAQWRKSSAAKGGMAMTSWEYSGDVKYTFPRGESGDVHAYVVKYVNSGTQPVYRVNINIQLDNGVYRADAPFLGPTSEAKNFEQGPDRFNATLIEIAEHHAQLSSAKSAETTSLTPKELRQRYYQTARISVQFADGNGAYWTRSPEGQLTPGEPRLMIKDYTAAISSLKKFRSRRTY